MSRENFESAIYLLMSRVPFLLFTVELRGGQRYEIDHPRSITFIHGMAFFESPGGLPVVFDHDSVNQIFDAPARLIPDGPNR